MSWPIEQTKKGYIFYLKRHFFYPVIPLWILVYAWLRFCWRHVSLFPVNNCEGYGKSSSGGPICNCQVQWVVCCFASPSLPRGPQQQQHESGDESSCVACVLTLAVFLSLRCHKNPSCTMSSTYCEYLPVARTQALLLFRRISHPLCQVQRYTAVHYPRSYIGVQRAPRDEFKGSHLHTQGF